MSITEVAAVLGGEPWCFTPQQIGKLTIPQVQEIYFRRRDNQGNIIRDPDREAAPTDPRTEFVRGWMRWGLSKERALELWREKRQKEKAKKADRRRVNKQKTRTRPPKG